MEGRLNHIELTKPPLRPDGPWPQRPDSRRTMRASGSASCRSHAVHIPAYPPPITAMSAVESPSRGPFGSTAGSWRSHHPCAS